MTDPLNRGSAPDRARDASDRPGSFKPGRKKTGGRKTGTPNRISREYKLALREAVDRVGSDGNAKDGALGYFVWVAYCDPDIFYGNLCMRLLYLQEHDAAMRPPAPPVPSAGPITDAMRESMREWIRELSKRDKARRRAPTIPAQPVIVPPPGQPTELVRILMALAVERHREFLKQFAAVFLTPPKDWRARAARNRKYC